MHPRRTVTHLLLCATLAIAGCSTSTRSPQNLSQRWIQASYWLLGERHDAPEHQQLAADTLQTLAQSGRLRALVLEMAERGRSTEGLPANAQEGMVRAALLWNEAGWPWAAYSAPIMTAVRAGIPVAGANLSRTQMHDAMKNEAIDATVTGLTREMHMKNVRDGHCNLLPEAQIGPMARVQIARDQSMASTLQQFQESAGPGQVTVLLAGSVHVDNTVGVPMHLPSGSAISVLMLAGGADVPDRLAPPGYDAVWPTPPVPDKDYCAGIPMKNKEPIKPPT
ncbi:MAG: ChaN family lipoprotein [Betaproteobacteria bacterium]|nr:ChaN family lipoprotein [Betaproteobacteria bacterium]